MSVRDYFINQIDIFMFLQENSGAWKYEKYKSGYCRGWEPGRHCECHLSSGCDDEGDKCLQPPSLQKNFKIHNTPGAKQLRFAPLSMTLFKKAVKIARSPALMVMALLFCYLPLIGWTIIIFLWNIPLNLHKSFKSISNDIKTTLYKLNGICVVSRASFGLWWLRYE